MSRGSRFHGRSLITRVALVLAAPISLHAQELPELPALPVSSPGQNLKEAELLFPQRPGGSGYRNSMDVDWRGDSVREEGALLVLTNGIVEQGHSGSERMLLRAANIEYDRFERTLKASGDVLFEYSEYKMSCQRLEVILGGSDEHITISGEAWGVIFEFPPSWSIQSRQVSFTSTPGDSLGFVGKLLGKEKAVRTTVFSFYEVSVTPCPQENPDWLARASKLELKAGSFSGNRGLEGYASLNNVVFRLGSAPIMWMPWVLFPARQDRAAGLLPPTIGYNEKLGAVLGLSYFQPLGQSADFTLSPTWYSKEGMMWGAETRWNPEITHNGSMNLRYIRPRTTGEARYQLKLHEIWDTENGWLIRADVNQASDQLMELEFGSAATVPLGTPAYDSSLFVGKNFKWAAFSMFATDRRSYFQPDDPFYNPVFPGSMQKLKIPEGQVRFYPVSIGPFYLDGSARIGRFGYSLDIGDEEPKTNYFWDRGDYQARIHGRLGQLGPFRASFQAGARFTQYSAVLTDSFFDTEHPDGSDILPPDPIDNPNFDPFRVEGASAQRWLGSSRIQISTPQIGRNFFNLKLGKYSGDIKHILEPVIAFTFNSKSRLAGVFPRFDEADVRPGVGNTAVGERSVEFGLKQHLFGRPDSTKMYADLVRFNISIKYYFDPIILSDGRMKQGWGTLDGNIDVEPSNKLRLSFRRSSEHLGSNADTSVSADLVVARSSLFSLAFFTSSINQLLVRERGIRVGGLHRMWEDKLRLRFEASYDFERETFTHSQVSLAYSTPCIEYSIRYRHIALPLVSLFGKEDRLDFALSINLNSKNVGEFFSAEIGNFLSRLFK